MSIAPIYKDVKLTKLLKKISSSIVEEHYHITLGIDSNLNYLLYMYYKGNKKSQFRPFIIGFELNLLLTLDIINSEEKESLGNMINSEDDDNVYMSLLALQSFRNKRIKLHGNWSVKDDNTKLPKVSEEFKEVVKNYHFKVVTNYSLDKL
jgi:hypothetical protein